MSHWMRHLTTSEVFEAVAHGRMTPEQGAALMLDKQKKPAGRLRIAIECLIGAAGVVAVIHSMASGPDSWPQLLLGLAVLAFLVRITGARHAA